MNMMNLKDGCSIACFSIMLLFLGQEVFADTEYSDIGKKTIQLCDAGRAEFTKIWQEGKHLSESEFKDTYGHDKLDAAAVSNEWKVIKKIVDEHGRGSDVAAHVMNEAATAGHARIVKALIDYGVSPDGYNIKEAPLVSAASCGRTNVVEVLLDNGANPNIQNIQLQDAMMQAAILSEPDIARQLLAHGYDPCINKTEDGRLVEDFISQKSLNESSNVWGRVSCISK